MTGIVHDLDFISELLYLKDTRQLLLSKHSN